MCVCVCVCVCVCARARGSITNFETKYFHRTCYERYFRVLKCGMVMKNGLSTTNTKVMFLCAVNNMIPPWKLFLPYISV